MRLCSGVDFSADQRLHSSRLNRGLYDFPIQLENRYHTDFSNHDAGEWVIVWRYTVDATHYRRDCGLLFRYDVVPIVWDVVEAPGVSAIPCEAAGDHNRQHDTSGDVQSRSFCDLPG